MSCAIERVAAARAEGGYQHLGWGATLTLCGGHALLLLTLCSLIFLVGSAVAAVRRRHSGWWTSIAVVSYAAGILSAVPVLWVAQRATEGAWISKQSYAAALPWAFAVLAGIATMAFVRLLLLFPPVRSGRPRSSWALTVALLAGAVLLINVDQRFQPNMHAPFHVFVFASAELLLALVALRVATILANKTGGPIATAVMIGLAAVMIVASALPTRAGAQLRSELLLNSTTATHWMRLFGTRASDTGVLEEALANRGDDGGLTRPLRKARTPNGNGPKARNVIWIVVDTLRADSLPPVRAKGLTHAQEGDTPNLDRWLDRSVRFRHAYAPAATTIQSMPAIFRSQESHADATGSGVPLARQMKRLGLRPVAAVSDLLAHPREYVYLTLLDDFDRYELVATDNPSEPRAQTRKLLEAVRDQPFFAWIHVMNMHEPGFAGEMLDGSRPPKERYREALRWLDGVFGELLAQLRALGLDENTIVCLTSDHGEGLGDNGVATHGATVFDEEIHVPLAIHVPGGQAGIVDASIGAVDLLPTIVDLMGGAEVPRHVGRSLRPWLEGETRSDERSFYAENNLKTVSSLIAGRGKLIFDQELNFFHRFDLGLDPKEARSIHGRDGTADRDLAVRMAQHGPHAFWPQDDAGALEQLISAAWQGLAKGGGYDGNLRLLFEMGLLSAARAEHAGSAAAVFAHLENDRQRLTFLELWFPEAPEALGGRLSAELQGMANTPREKAWLRALQADGQGPFRLPWVNRRLQEVGHSHDEEMIRLWSELVETWPKDSVQAEPFLSALRSRDGAPGARLRESLLLNLASFDPTQLSERVRKEALTAARQSVDHDALGVRKAAWRVRMALGESADRSAARERIQDPGTELSLKRLLVNETPQWSNREALDALGAAVDDPALTLWALHALGERSDPKSLAMLTRFAQNGIDTRIRLHASEMLLARRPD